jgi:deazaflavin-dependent oxidoreductase (nitroreductase family)
VRSDRMFSRITTSIPVSAVRASGKLQTRFYRLSGGRLWGKFARKPVLVLTTTDRRSGQSRSTVVLYMANGENMVVIGSNAGNEGPPAWALNLLANPEAKGTSLVLFDTEENAEAASQALRVGSSPAPWVTVTRREVREVADSA